MMSISLRRRGILLIALASCLAVPVAILGALWFTLPSVNDLHQRAQAPSTRILDRNGLLLYEIIDPRTGHHTPLPFSQIPLRMRQAAIAAEDANFYSNPGVDIVGIIRALWINIQGGEVVAGGSTITQQLARLLLLDPQERNQRTLLRKIRESLLAWQISQRYSKDDVLALYLNETYYGNLAYGIEAAAHTYFGKSSSQLDLSECALLAGLLQSPVAYDPFIDPEAARQRQNVVLDLMVKQGYISESDAQIARQARLSYAPAPYPIRAPHFVTYVRHWLEDRFGTELVTRGGLIVTTTLDLSLNETAQDIIRARLEQLQSPNDNTGGHNTNDSALVALNPHTGAIIAMVGSPDFFNAQISGAVNAAVMLRQPGSAIKPVTYAAAFSHVPGFTAATPIMDVRTAFPTREGLPYVPSNYDGIHHGPISVRSALATSNNVAAVSVLQKVGLDRMLSLANELGIHSFRSVDEYGLALTLGGGEVRLLELTAAYGAFANSGVAILPYSVSRVVDSSGNVLYSHHDYEGQKQVLDPRIAWLITDILSDNAARSEAFGLNSVLRLDRPAAVKTGTTTDWRDNWTVGYIPDLVTGVWTGNADGEPMVRVSGVSGAGPIWHDFMIAATRGQVAQSFTQPPGLKQITVCALSGMLPSPDCTHTRSEWFVDGTEPTQIDNWYTRIKIDVATGEPATPSTPPERVSERVALALPDSVREWAARQGWLLADTGTTVASPAMAQHSCGQAGQPECPPATIVQPDAGSIYQISRQLPRSVQKIPLEVRVDDTRVVRAEVIVDNTKIIASFDSGSYKGFWLLDGGDHSFLTKVYYADGSYKLSAPTRVHVNE